jgi:arginyl-tRNA synthetase
MIRKILKDYLSKALKEAGYREVEPEVLKTTDSRFGDYYSSVALKLVKEGNKQPAEEIARFLVAKLAKNEELFRAEAAQGGFINFTISAKYLRSSIRKIIEEGEKFGSIKIGKGKKVQVEFISANPTGPLTLGNGRGGFTGDTLAYCLEAAGYQVEREYYINDTGNQIKTLGLSVLDVLGVKAPDRAGLYRGEYVVEIAQEVEKNIDIERYKMKPDEVGEMAAKIAFEKFIRPLLTKINIKFDNFVSEKGLHRSGEVAATLGLLKTKGLVEDKEGAVWFKSEANLEEADRVLVRSEINGQRSPTYFLADIAYHLNKFSRGYHKVIDIWGADHAGYVPRIRSVAKEFGFDEKLDIIIVQLVRLIEGEKEVRMSKRTGTFVTLKELVDSVGLDAARFFFISQAANSHMDFDLRSAREQSLKNPVYYVQYAHARANSILKMAQKNGFRFDNISNIDLELLKHPSELALIRALIKLPELIEDICQTYAVHLLPTYTREVADLFHKFYEQVRVIDTKDRETSLARIALATAVKTVLRNSLQLMGISQPESMEKIESDETRNRKSSE